MTIGALSQHISKQFDNELENIRERVLAMGGLVEQQLINSLRALMESEVEFAETVLKSEPQVNTLEISIDEDCTKILARRQPTARDLRLVMAVIKTITDLERIGDESEKIAKMAIELIEKQGPKSYYMGINAMGILVRKMVHGSLDAFARMDTRTALDVASDEPKSDDMYDATLRHLITYMMEDPHHITGAIDAIWAARSLERIADHARNICEYVIYFVEGKDVRHTTIEEMEKEISSS
jgi:phosphate transport system protein